MGKNFGEGEDLMKMYASNLGTETMITVLLPGMVAAVAMVLFKIPADQADQSVDWATSAPYLVGFVE